MQSTPALLVSYLYSTVESNPLGGRFITSQALGQGVLMNRSGRTCPMRKRRLDRVPGFPADGRIFTHNLPESKSLFQLDMFWNVQGHQNVYLTLFSSVTHGAQSLRFQLRYF
jgi:hypothetical protein